VNRTGCRASLLTSVRVIPWASIAPLSAPWRMNRPGRRPRLETAWASNGAGSRDLRPPLVEDGTVMEAVPDSKSGERETAGGRVLRLPLLDGEPAGRQAPV
jgi:hypothetical protein